MRIDGMHKKYGGFLEIVLDNLVMLTYNLQGLRRNEQKSLARNEKMLDKGLGLWYYVKVRCSEQLYLVN